MYVLNIKIRMCYVVTFIQGDGGSPLVCQIPGTDRYAQYGIVSWGNLIFILIIKFKIFK